jgi:hypothetical protein
MLKMKTILTEAKYLSARQVKPGMIGIDYNGEKCKVLTIVPAKNWKQLKKYDHSGWMYDQKSMEDDYEVNFNTDYLVAVDGDGQIDVFVYRGDGVLVPVKQVKEAKHSPVGIKAIGRGKDIGRDEDIEYAQNAVDSEWYDFENQIEKFKEMIDGEIKGLPKEYQQKTLVAVQKVWNEFRKSMIHLRGDIDTALEAGLKKK